MDRSQTTQQLGYEFALLRDLVSREGVPILDLPYTPAFDRIFHNFQQRTRLDLNQHDLWERLVRLDDYPHVADDDAPGTPLSGTAPGLTVSAPTGATSVQFPTSLFPDPVATARQPWTVSRQASPSSVPEVDVRRERILANLANSTLGTIEQKVAFILDRYPETRNSDVSLCIRYWRYHQPDELNEWDDPELEVLYDLDKWATIVRLRAELQNDLGLFRASDEAILNRSLGQTGFHQYLKVHQDVRPEVRFYLDETGNEGDKRYTGVAGICAMNWKQYEMHFASIARWRRQLQWPGNIHFSDTGASGLERAIALLGQLEAHRSGLLFVGYALPSQGRTHPDMVSLFVQLIVDSLRQMRVNGCFPEPRLLRVIKEADTGFDSIYLEKMTAMLADLTAIEFPGLVVVERIEPVPKGSTVFLECADLIAGGMQRRALSKGSTARDRLAEAVANVTGFEHPADGGVVFKCYPYPTRP